MRDSTRREQVWDRVWSDPHRREECGTVNYVGACLRARASPGAISKISGSIRGRVFGETTRGVRERIRSCAGGGT